MPLIYLNNTKVCHPVLSRKTRLVGVSPGPCSLGASNCLPRVCLVHFAKMCKDVNRAFEVLNEVYLQNFLHRWVVNRETNLMMLINPCLINN